MKAEVGDQLVGQGFRPGQCEIVGVVVEVQGEDGGPPFVIRWYENDSESTISPDPEQYWIRSHRMTHEVRVTNAAIHRVA